MTRVLLDTHIVIAVLDNAIKSLPHPIGSLLEQDGLEAHVSLATHWELAIKYRIGKIKLPVRPADISSVLTQNGIDVLDIEEEHIFANIGSEPNTRDPFDRLLLGVCAAEELTLVTLDRALEMHALAWRPY